MSDDSDDPLLGIAAAPAFAEIRNLLIPLLQNLSLARVATAELHTAGGQLISAEIEISDPVRLWIDAGHETAEHLIDLLGDLESVAFRLQTTILAIEKTALAGSSETGLNEVFEVADQLALHNTKLIGGVRWPTVSDRERVAVPRAVAIGLMAAALAKLASAEIESGMQSALKVHLASTNEVIEVCIETSLSAAQLERIARTLGGLVGKDPSIVVDARGSALVLRLPRSHLIPLE